jgi:hypothetical protein
MRVDATAYSRRRAEVWAASGDGEEGAASMLGRHVSGEIRGGLLVGFALVAAPFHEEAVGQASKEAVDGDGVG